MLLFLFCGSSLMAQETYIGSVTYGDCLQLKNKRRGVTFKLKNDYIFDFGGFVPTFNRNDLQNQHDGSVVTYPGRDEVFLLIYSL